MTKGLVKEIAYEAMVAMCKEGEFWGSALTKMESWVDLQLKNIAKLSHGIFKTKNRKWIAEPEPEDVGGPPAPGLGFHFQVPMGTTSYSPRMCTG